MYQCTKAGGGHEPDRSVLLLVPLVTLLWSAIGSLPAACFPVDAGSVLTTGMTYMDGDTVMDYHSPVPGDADDEPTRYGFYLYEQIYGTIYPPTPASREDFDLDEWIGSLYPEGSLCTPVASIGFGLM